MDLVRLSGLFAAIAVAALAVVLAAGVAPGQGAPEGRSTVVLAAIEGAIGPATQRHVEEVIESAEESGAEALVLRLDTPGGLAQSMRRIIEEVLGSTVPVIGWVAPPGAHAASAGTYILYATHIAAMAPGTNLGAATPVQIGGMPGTPQPGGEEPAEEGVEGGEEADGDQPAPTAPADPMTAKATNDAVAFIRSLAEMHGRNADWAEKAVREAASLSARQALEQDVIEIVAEDLDDLLAAVDGRTVEIGGREVVLSTADAAVERIEPGPMTRFLAVLSNPNIALVLMMIGIYGIIFEFLNPGGIGPGVIGAISLTLGLYALNQLPLDYAGLALIILGVAFMVAEAFSPTCGVLGIGGLVSFVTGAAILVDTDVPAYQVSPWVIGTMAAASGAFLILVLGFTLRAYKRAPVGGAEGLVGAEASVLEWSGDGGYVWTAGERWRATGPAGLAAGDRVRVRRLEGLTLIVAPPEGAESD